MTNDQLRDLLKGEMGIMLDDSEIEMLSDMSDVDAHNAACSYAEYMEEKYK